MVYPCPRSPRSRIENAVARRCLHARGAESRHIRSYEDNEDSQQGLDPYPPGVAQKGGIARLDLQRWQQLALKTVRNKQNATEEGELNTQQVSIEGPNHAREIADQIPGQYPPVARMTTMATVATREKWRRIAPAKSLVSSPIDPTPINKMSAGRPPSQTLKASRCAMAAASRSIGDRAWSDGWRKAPPPG